MSALSESEMQKLLLENLKKVDLLPVVKPIFERLKNDLRAHAQVAPPSERDKMLHYVQSLKLAKTDSGFQITSDSLMHSPEEDQKALDLMEYGSAAQGIPATNAWANFKGQLLSARNDLEKAVGEKLFEGLFK
jgi:hypothetical protein